MKNKLVIANEARPVAMYLRMSSDLQKHSIENQEDAISRYAENHGMECVKSYQDDAKSGVRIENRAALKNLLTDVQSGTAGFSAVLVYDVSRWGRFQNTDQAAYYDYLCNMHGIEVIYVAEQFLNDGSPFSAILKNLKRAMAGEYSRELSVKCKAGQVRLARLGFCMGGTVLYGLRRMVLNHLGQPRMVLAIGERKAIQSDHVVLVPGPDEEIALVRRIFQMFTTYGMEISDIIRKLTSEGLKTHHGADFGRAGVRRILRCEAFVGTNVWNQTTVYLGGPAVDNPPEMWIRSDTGFAPLIATEVFARAQKRFARFRLLKFRTRDQLLDDLRSTLKAEGRLTIRLVSDRGGACREGYRREFGSLGEAYRLVGYVPDRSLQVNERAYTQGLVSSQLSRLKSGLDGLGIAVRIDKRSAKLVVNDSVEIGMLLTYELPATDTGNSCRWRLCDRDQRLDFLVIARMNSDRKTVRDYFVVPKSHRASFPTMLRPINQPPVDALRVSERGLVGACISSLFPERRRVKVVRTTRRSK